jgi:predicted nucleic acid-binding protein
LGTLGEQELDEGARREKAGVRREALQELPAPRVAVALQGRRHAQAREEARVIRAIARRDAIRVALMQRNDVSRVLTFDAGFDRGPGIAFDASQAGPAAAG